MGQDASISAEGHGPTRGLPLASAFVIEPEAAFLQIRNQPTFLFPLMLMVIGNAAVLAVYYGNVDIDWMVTAIAGAQFSDHERSIVASHVSRGTIMAATLSSSIIALVAGALVQALYFLIADRLSGIGLSFKRWFSFVCWSSIVGVLSSPLMAIQVYRSLHERIAPNALDTSSLNFLVLNLPLDDKWAGLVSSFGIFTLWVALLQAIGWKAWTGKGWPISLLVAATPYALWYGGWALYLLFRG